MAKREARTQSRWIRAIPMGLLGTVVGFGAGATVAGFVGGLGGRLMLGLPVFFALLTGSAAYLVGALVIETTGDVVARIYGGGGSGTKREYSAAQALAVRGDHEAAVKLYAEAAAEYPEDPEPLIRGAAVLVEGVKDYAAAVEWLQRARKIERLTPEADVTIARELVDLFDGPLEEPRKALPELARIAEAYPNTTAGEWAGRRLARLRTEVWEDVKEQDLPEPAPPKPPPNRDPTI